MAISGLASESAVASASGIRLSPRNHISIEPPLRTPRTRCSGSFRVAKAATPIRASHGISTQNPKTLRKKAISNGWRPAETKRTDPCIEASARLAASIRSTAASPGRASARAETAEASRPSAVNRRTAR